MMTVNQLHEALTKAKDEGHGAAPVVFENDAGTRVALSVASVDRGAKQYLPGESDVQPVVIVKE